MSSEKYALPLYLDVQISQKLRWIIVIAHVWCLLLVLALAAQIVIKAVLLLMLIASLIYYLNRFYLNKHCMPCSLILKDQAQVRLQLANGRVERATIIADTYLHASLVILRMKTENGVVISLPLLRDTMNEAQHRQLRVYLRLQQYRMEADKKKTPAINI